MKLSGKTAVITGGNSGIGFGIARRLADEGATGIIIGRNQQTLNDASKKLDGAFLPIKCDVTQIESLESAFKNAEEQFGGIDVLVVNAGGAVGPGSVQPFIDVAESSFDAMTDLNLKSTFFTVQKALPHLNDGASIILVSSIAAHKAFPGMSVYAAAKAGVRSLARTLSAELMERGIRVNVLSPGTIDTPVFDKMGFTEAEVSDIKSGFKDIIPMHRTGTADEMGGVAVFLASSDSSFVVGEEIVADGGVVNL
jgi:NAD(P)-dependent dehydrogenase (short-subunit alcohol dehydrogenase family)